MVVITLLAAVGFLMGLKFGWGVLATASLGVLSLSISVWIRRVSLDATDVLLLVAYLSSLQGGYLIGSGIYAAQNP